MGKNINDKLAESLCIAMQTAPTVRERDLLFEKLLDLKESKNIMGDFIKRYFTPLDDAEDIAQMVRLAMFDIAMKHEEGDKWSFFAKSYVSSRCRIFTRIKQQCGSSKKPRDVSVLEAGYSDMPAILDILPAKEAVDSVENRDEVNHMISLLKPHLSDSEATIMELYCVQSMTMEEVARYLWEGKKKMTQREFTRQLKMVDNAVQRVRVKAKTIKQFHNQKQPA